MEARGEMMSEGGPAVDAFVAHRNLLFTVAYEMLGSAADAEDVLQETWLRWADADLATVRDQRAYLVRITTRQSLNRLRTVGRRRESYVGSWLPEPLLTAPDVADDVELAESVSMAMMLVLETLAPIERAVFVLREVFDLAYDEIAQAVDKSPAAVRQIAHRARAHVAARRPRGVVSAADTRRVLTRSSGRSRPATCRACSTSSRRMSCSWATAAVSDRRCCGRSPGLTRWPACWPAGSSRPLPCRCTRPR
ncbi:RNA polymerase sigma-70 factor (ECF subfamily) [Micromonospora jinlongensis]|uniref:RNA polymerase sigma-70 factor (ECF subfamily) n=1 Tax=Micromonospora jinlongensis TaxID=1287877 RepID=A0A7Z0BCC8_9ACTN|nr:RNA polymerase sigma-70 factor (ECF subfamily) [Micromonospora jinlongensis]